jgi:hypothetical protein
MTRTLALCLAWLIPTACRSTADPAAARPPGPPPSAIPWPDPGDQPLQTRARITLESPDESRVTLDALLIWHKPDRLRVRCWKFDRPVMDLVVVGDSGWLWTAARSEGESAFGGDAMRDAARLAPALRALMGDSAAWRLESRADDGVLRYVKGPATVELNGEPPRVRRVVMPGHAGELSRLTFDDHRPLNGGSIPWRIEASGPGGRLIVRLVECKSGAAIAPGAFDPPPGARPLSPGDSP